MVENKNIRVVKEDAVLGNEINDFEKLFGAGYDGFIYPFTVSFCDEGKYEVIIEGKKAVARKVDDGYDGLLISGPSRMIKLENWTEITKGLYRYVVSPSCCYEICIMHHVKDTDILAANASLYIVGDWTMLDNGSKYFKRVLLLNESLAACLEKAKEYARMM